MGRGRGVLAALAVLALVGCQESCPSGFTDSKDGTCISSDLRTVLSRPEKNACSPGQAEYLAGTCRCLKNQSVYDARAGGAACGSCERGPDVKWCRVAVTPPASLLAETFENGELALKREDCQLAVRIFRTLAEKGHAGAQYQYGEMLYFPRCMSRDVGQAILWLRRAANQNEARAFGILGLIYRSGIQYGEGVPKDNVQAYMWFTLAIERKIDWVESSRADLARQMTAADIAEGARRAREWRPD
jgi:TPR repeat protein